MNIEHLVMKQQPIQPFILHTIRNTETATQNCHSPDLSHYPFQNHLLNAISVRVQSQARNQMMSIKSTSVY